MTLIYDIIFRTNGGIPQYQIDPRLDLDSTLLDSSIFPFADWLYDSHTYAPISPEPRTPFSVSSSLSSSQSSMSSLQSYIAKSERRKSQENSYQTIQKPIPIRPTPTTNRPSFFPATHMRLLPPTPPPSASPTPAPLVLYMQRHVSSVQWADDFFHDFVNNDTSHSLETKSLLASIWANT